MPSPHVDLLHLKTSRQEQDGSLIERYWFQWSNRRKWGKMALRLDLLDEQGKPISRSVIRLPPVRVQGYIPPTGTRPQQLIYDSDVRIYLDLMVGERQPVFFSYCTIGVYKSESVRGLLKGKLEEESPVL
ncbi:MAG TPA: hypothetical protein VK404_12770 [Spirosoma sp.]|nr:hypothetical protein [Spirosoma sp.]